MTCARCAELQSELQELKRDLYFDENQQFNLSISRAFGVGDQKASIIAVLYRAVGRTVIHAIIDERIEEHGAVECTSNLRSVLIHQIRARLGPGAIENQHSHGYRMTEAGRDVVDAAIRRSAAKR